MFAEIAELLQITLKHGHALTIEPNIDNYPLDIGIGASALEEEALSPEEILTLESAPYAAADAHGSRCEACRRSTALPLEPGHDPRRHRAESWTRRAPAAGGGWPRGHDRERTPRGVRSSLGPGAGGYVREPARHAAGAVASSVTESPHSAKAAVRRV